MAWKHYALDSNLFNVQLKSFRQKQLWASWFHAILLSLLLYLILYYCNTINHPLSIPFLQCSFTLSRICYLLKRSFIFLSFYSCLSLILSLLTSKSSSWNWHRESLNAAFYLFVWFFVWLMCKQLHFNLKIHSLFLVANNYDISR